ncbi:MAG: PEP-CTERM sorting domain-containing protein [Kiritimatiellae bacterium]|nr:PEP-CTERM sorting domain-containing protein [Kiritimatiellia bacterium]
MNDNTTSTSAPGGIQPPKVPGFFSRVFRTITAGGWLLLVFSVILPTITIVVEAATHMCAELFFDPIPTPFHLALIASVPLFNLVVWLCCRFGWLKGRSLPAFLCGFSLIISALNAILFLPLAAIGALGCFFLWWLYGIGLLGILPLSPVFAFIANFFLRRRLRLAGDGRLTGFGWGICVACLTCLMLIGNYVMGISGAVMAKSPDPAVSTRGIKLLRASGRKDALKTLADHWGPDFSLTRFCLPDTCRLSRNEYLSIYYRMTGEELDDLWRMSRSRGRRQLWDRITGGTQVGGVLEGLSLTGSAYDHTVDAAAGVGYVEWTLVFSNTFNIDREARARIALPPGSAVSRLTLWINGEECEAAFGKRGQVRAAYESIVAKHRDPVLVGVCGPNQIQLQCYPVPSEGEMKVRLGVTVPLKVSEDGKRAILPPPHLFAQNFTYSPSLLGMPAPISVGLEPALAPVTVYKDDAFEPMKGKAILQKATLAPKWEPAHVTVVVDGSRSMKKVIREVTQALNGLPHGAAVTLWFVQDEQAKEPDLVTTATGRDRENALAGVLKPGRCTGGRCNLYALNAAARSLEGKAGPSALVWIHGAQPLPSQSAETVAQQFGKLAETRIFAIQIDSGTCQITEKLEMTPNVTALTVDPISGSVGEVLRECFAEWKNPAWQMVRTQIPQADVPAGAVAVSRHIGRLWAAEKIRSTIRVGHPKTFEEAQQVAVPWQIVTPVTSAVVLETAKQYQDNGLKPMNANDVPTVPEPAAILSLALAICILLAFLLWKRRRAMEPNEH